MDTTYGTYLDYLLLKELLAEKSPLSIKELANRIHQYQSKRERTNFYYRVRRSLLALDGKGYLEKLESKKGNIFFHKYTIKDEKRHGLLERVKAKT